MRKSSLPRSKKQGFKKLLVRLGIVFLGVLGLGGALEIAIRTAPLPPSLQSSLVSTPVVLDCHGTVMAELPGREARLQFPVSAGALSPWLIRATIGLEDRRFYQHSGIDVPAIGIAFFRNLRSGRIMAGASTLTQQLIKNSQPPQPRTWGRKLREALAALRLEREWTKEQILTRYLNQVSYGNRFHGAEAAARQYFGKSAASLTAPEALFLAALPRAPTRYNPWRHPAEAGQRYQFALGRLQDAGVLTAAEREQWRTPPTVLPRQPTVILASHFVQHLQRQHPHLAGTVRTTLDLSLQARVESIVARHLRRLTLHQARDAAVLVLNHQTGAIRAWVSASLSKTGQGQINGVTLPRSAGSILKPFLYLQALDRRLITAATLLPDTPDAIRSEYVDYDPKNYDQRFWGPVRMREALANSLNVPAVLTLARVGARAALNGLHDAGIHTARGLEDYGAGLILGNAEVRMLDVTAAFGTFANHGTLSQPVCLQGESPRHRVIASPSAADILADVLSDNDARRKSFGPFTPLAFENRRIACKTGTSSGFRDAWTLGATAQHCVGVWIGNFSGAPMRELASVTGPAPLWRDIMNQVLTLDPSLPPLVESAALRPREICAVTGLLPTAASPSRVQEWFLPGTEPEADADSYYQARPNGPPQLTLPSTYELWCASSHNYLGAAVSAGEPLNIVSPRQGAQFIIDPHLPRSRQKLELRAIGAQGQPLEWWLNHAPLATSPPGQTLTWPLVRGAHHLEVRCGPEKATVTFTVGDP
ncbi:penicillin-binding protein 1C [Prosthecobacter dejongeii]|uniref:peptidoglycan glycosyltransferase n=1 Tax=Prosthecobacter dejongeii TaxID=48465 RepID=A0A7W7YJY0_9BACT|nr:penicillin-binding protein 1C [Prosthecobacter dejongeii]MBB5037573.1 penicillin-binding protein 1C [Prosthecobacter dejongeii]